MYTALNISSRNIKILALKGKRVAAWGTIDLAEGLVDQGVISNPQAVGEAINALFKSTGISRTNVIVSIASLPFTYRVIKLPKINAALTEESVLRTAKKEISLPLDELYVSWQPIPGKGEQQDVFVLGVPRNAVDKLLEALKIANVEPYLMDLRPLALARAANQSNAIVVNMESDCFDIALISNGVPALIHTISPRSEGATLEDQVHRLTDELTKIIAFNQSSYPDIQLSPQTPLLLTGDLTADKSTGELIQSDVDYPVEPLIPPVNIPKDLPIPSYATNIGLSIKKTTIKPVTRGEDSFFQDININVLEGKYRRPKAKALGGKSLVIAALLVVAVAVLIPLNQMRTQANTENEALGTELNRINREINLANLVYEQVLTTESTISDILLAIEALKAANNSILDARGNFSTGLQKVTGIFPANTYFTSIEILGEQITITGEADDVFTVIKYATALETSGLFTEVRITMLNETIVDIPVTEETEPTDTTQATVIIFEILCTY